MALPFTGKVGRYSSVSDPLIYDLDISPRAAALSNFKSTTTSLHPRLPPELLFWHHVSLSDTDRSLNLYMDSSHAMPTRISSPSSHNPCEPADWCVWHPKWTETARGGKKRATPRGLLVHHSVLCEKRLDVVVFLTPLHPGSSKTFSSLTSSSWVQFLFSLHLSGRRSAISCFFL